MHWQLGGRSDAEVLARLGVLVSSTRQLTAELVAHLGEVEERRLHLIAACGSMFQYCVTRLGMSEDEACRRIDVARLARRFPLLFPAIASGRLSLSVVALLKQHLGEENQADLIRQLSGKSVRQAQECLAALFPRPDVASSLRKLPDRVASSSTALPEGAASRMMNHDSAPMGSDGKAVESSGGGERAHDRRVVQATAEGGPKGLNPSGNSAGGGFGQHGGVGVEQGSLSQVTRRTTTATASPSRMLTGHVEPLSAARYRMQFTAGSALKEKLELARDLMRHANPSGDFAPIVERALDLLLEELMQRRFGKTRRTRTAAGATSSGQERCRNGRRPRGKTVTPAAQPECEGASTTLMSERPSTSPPPGPNAASSPRANDAHALDPDVPVAPCADTSASPGTRADDRSPPRQRITSATRRAVVARDGLQCSWVDEQGRRCTSRAWLEYDHVQPLGKGGGSEPANTRILCRGHNHLSAEQAYGREHVASAIRCTSTSHPKFVPGFAQGPSE